MNGFFSFICLLNSLISTLVNGISTVDLTNYQLSNEISMNNSRYCWVEYTK